MCHSCLGTGGKGGQGLLRAKTTQLAPRPLDSGRVGGAEREYPAENIVPLVGGQGDASSRSRIGMAIYSFAPSRSLFLNDNLIKLRSHLRKGTVDSDGKQTISLHVSCSLPAAQPTSPRLLRGTPASLCPRPPLSTLPAGGAGGEAGEARGTCAGSATGAPGIGICVARLPRLPLRSRLPRLNPGPSPHMPECARQHPVVFPCRAWLPASPFLRVPLPCRAAHTPARSSRSSLWFALHCFAPSGFLLSESPGELVWASVLFGGSLCPPPSRMACDAAGPSGHLGHVCEFVAPLPAAAWGLLLSVHCPAFSISVSPPPPSWRVVPSTPLDLTRTVAPAVDFPVTVPDGRHTVFYRKAAVVPAPFSFVPLSRFFQTVWCSVCKSIILRIAFVNIFVNILVLSLIIFDIFMTWL